MAITASDPGQSADVKIGGDLVVGGDLAVPAGQTWRVNGNVKIEDGAVIRIENGATLALTGIDADRAVGGGQQQRRITVSDAVRYLAGDDGGHQQAQIVLRAPAEPEPGELERLSAEIKQYALEPEPTDAERQRVDLIRRAALGEGDPDLAEFAAQLRAPIDPAVLSGSAVSAKHEFAAQLRAEADRFSLVSPADAERLRAQIDNPFLLSPDEAQRVAAQFTSSMAPVALGEYAAELMRPPRPLLGEYQSAWAESIRQALEPIGLSAALAAQAAALGIVHQALNPMALDMISTTMEMMREPSRQMAEMAASWAQPFGAMDVGWAAMSLSRDLQMARGALGDLSMAQNALRNSGYSLGLLDDTNRAIDRLHEQRQAAAEQQVQGVLLRLRPQPEPPAERVHVVHVAPGDWRDALTHALTSGQASPRDVGEFLHSLSAQQRQAGPFPPEWALIEAVVAIYKQDGHKHTYATFVTHLARKGIDTSMATFKRWIEQYENFTGEQVRPGKGKKGRKQL